MALAQEVEVLIPTLASLPMAVMATDCSGVVRWANACLSNLTGCAVDEIVGQDAEMLESENTTHPLQDILQHVVAFGEPWRGESVGKCKNGELYDIEQTITPIRDRSNAVTHALWTLQNITGRKLATERLEQLQEVVSAAQLAGNFAVFKWNARTGKSQWSPETLYRYGLDPKATEPSFDTWVQSAHAHDRDRVLREFRQTLDSPEGRLNIEYRSLDGLRWFAGSGRLYRDAEGKPDHMVIINIDITERKRAEEEKAKLQGQLHQAQKMEAVGLLAGGIAHDFNNLLTVITGCSQVLLDELALDNPLRIEAEEIVKAGERAATLTSRLLAFSRRQVTRLAAIDLNRLVADTDGMLRRVIGEDIELRTSFGEDLGQVQADPGQIEHLIMNLVVNARDAMPGGGSLTIQTANVGRDEKFMPGAGPAGSGPFVMFSVADTGVGMDEETKGHLFEPFFTTKAPGKGTGLGLSTVWAIVKQCGGEIWVGSEPGQGTKFRIYLPRAVAQPGIPEESKSLADSGAATETVLLVEDEDRVRRLVLGMLRRHGYTVLEAPDGETALDLAQRHSAPIHVLLTDVVMPKMNGHGLASRLVALQPDIRVVYMSGYVDNPLVYQEIVASGAAFLQKPFTQKALVAKIRGVLEGASKRARAG